MKTLQQARSASLSTLCSFTVLDQKATERFIFLWRHGSKRCDASPRREGRREKKEFHERVRHRPKSHFKKRNMIDGPYLFISLFLLFALFFMHTRVFSSHSFFFFSKRFRFLYLAYVYLVDNDCGWVPLVDNDQFMCDNQSINTNAPTDLPFRMYVTLTGFMDVIQSVSELKFKTCPCYQSSTSVISAPSLPTEGDRVYDSHRRKHTTTTL